MKIKIDDDLRSICKEIFSDDHTEEEWAEMESGDMFQRGKYSGGFDADDMFFAFSFDDENHVQWCFSLSLSEVEGIVSGLIKELAVDRWDDLMKQLEGN